MNDDQLTIFRRRNIGFVFQNYNLVPILNIYGNIVLPLSFTENRNTSGAHMWIPIDTIYRILKKIGMSLHYHYPVIPVCIFIAILLFIQLLITAFTVQSLKKQSLVERIRNNANLIKV